MASRGLFFLLPLAFAGGAPAQRFAPYTLYSTEYFSSARGGFNNKAIAKIVEARRRDGSVARQYRHLPVRDGDVAWDEGTIADLAARKWIETAEFLKAKSTYRLSETQARQHLAASGDPARGCMQYANGQPVYSGPAAAAGKETIAGVATIRITRGLPPQQTIRSWHAPALNCAAVQTEITTFDAGGRPDDVTVRKADRIVLGDPDPALFNPALEELKPSVVQERRRAKLGGTVSEQSQARARKADETYLRSRP